MNALAHFPPDRTSALERLAAFVPDAGRHYAERRNFDLGAGNHTGVSGLSPWLRTRLVTEKEVLQAVLGRHSLKSSEKFVQEVFWRTYWKGWLEMRPGVWTRYRADVKKQLNAVQTQSGLRDQWEAACTGNTGIDCFDHWARELAETGYLHNHARMWFASIWIFTLRLPWELGADFFLRHLLDGDPASNTLGWRWVAGIQTRGKTYLARVSNIAKYTEDRFHPKWQLAGEAPPVPAPETPDRQDIAAETVRDNSLRTGFLLHAEDLSPGFAKPEGPCAVLRAETGLSPLDLAPHIEAFHDGAIADCMSRHDLTADISATSADDVIAWATEHGLEQIVTPRAPVGPAADVLRQTHAHPHLRLVQVRRAWDSDAWPYATHGFFRFKDKIPHLLENSGLTPTAA